MAVIARMSEEIIKEEVTKARKIFEQYSMVISKTYCGSFPKGSCGTVSEILASWLSCQGVDGLKIAWGKRGKQSHAWLELNDLIIDITSDQFKDGVGAVFVSTDSTFHESFLGKKTYKPSIGSTLVGPCNKFKKYMNNT